MSGINRLLFIVIAAGTAWWISAGAEPSLAAASERNLLWQSRDQFVALEPQDAGESGPPPANEHPAAVTDLQLTTLLSRLQFRPAENTTTEPLFTAKSLATLIPELVTGLKMASSGEDVTFAVIGLHDALYGLAREPRVTTGRLFVSGGRLNLIVGLAQKVVNEREDRRLAPFTPGSRERVARGEWMLQPPADPPGYTGLRRDWIAVDLNWLPVISQEATQAEHQPQADDRKSPVRNPVERLKTLNELLKSGLITDEEYNRKRQQILNEL